MFFGSIRNRFFRILARGVTIILLLIVVLLIVASIYVRSNKQKLAGIITTNINKSIGGKFEVKDIDVSTISHFPNIGVDLSDIRLTDSVYHRPLLQCQLLSFRFSIFKLWDIKHQIAKVVIENGSVNFFTDSNGYKNTSMFRKKEKSASDPTGSFIIHQIEIKNVGFRIDDATKAKHYDFHFDELTASVNNKDSVTEFDVYQKTLVRQLTFKEERGSYLEKQTLDGKLDLRFNTVTQTLSCNRSTIKINGQKYTISARFILSGQPRFHLDATSDDLPFEKGRALLTPKLRTTLGNIRLKDPIDVKASIDGLMKFRAIPLVNIKWQTEKNELSAGPVTFQECSITGTFINQIADTLPRTDEFSRVVLNSFSGNFNGLKVDGKNIIVTNLLKPYAQFELHSDAVLTELEGRLTLKDITFLSGSAQIDLRYDGPLTTDLAHLKNLTATFALTDASLEYQPKNVLLERCSGEFTVGENTLLFKKFQFDVQRTHIEINASGQDIASLSSTETGKAALQLSLYSPYLHFDEILRLLASDKKATPKKDNPQLGAITSGVNDLFENANFRINLRADTFSNGAFYARNLQASLLIQKDAWQLENISMQHAGGVIKVAGSLRKNGSSQAMLSTNVQIQHVNVQQLFKAFNNFGQTGMTSDNLRGSLTATAQLSMQLYARNGGVISSGRNGYVDFSLMNGAIINHKDLEQIKILFLKDRDMSNIRFAELKDRIDVNPTDIYINRMEIQSTAVTMYVEGRYDFLKKNTDLLIQVPVSNMKKRDEDYKAKNKGVNAKTGASILIRAKSGDDGNMKFTPTLSKKVKAAKE